MYFAKQGTPTENDSSIPTEKNCLCEARISVVDFEHQDVLNFFGALNINKAYDRDNIPEPMLKICDSRISNALSIMFRNSLNSGIFPDNSKRSIFLLVLEKENKQLINIFRPVALLSVSNKIFERLILNLLCKFVEKLFILFVLFQSIWIQKNFCL